MTKTTITELLAGLNNPVDLARRLEVEDELIARDAEQRKVIEQQAQEIARLREEVQTGEAVQIALTTLLASKKDETSK